MAEYVTDMNKNKWADSEKVKKKKNRFFYRPDQETVLNVNFIPDTQSAQ